MTDQSSPTTTYQQIDNQRNDQRRYQVRAGSGTGVVLIEGWDRDPELYGARRTETWETWLDGAVLGNAYTEAEGYRWIEDMRRVEADREGR